MRAQVNALIANAVVAWGVATAFGAVLPPRAGAQEPAGPEQHFAREGERRWVPSLAVRSGVWLQSQDGATDSCLFANPANATGACPAPGSTPLRPSDKDDDLAIASFVGANLELMSPALPIPTRPRLFVSGEILPTFSADRDLAGERDPTCVMGPLLTDVGQCVDPTVPRTSSFGEADANGEGSVVTTTYDTLSFGANVGVGFPVQLGERRLLIKPSVGWISYKAELEGKVIDAACVPITSCTAVTQGTPGTMREVDLTGSDSRRFHGIGPGLDVEVDTGRFGPLGTSIFLGGGAYWTFGNRTLEAEMTTVYPNDGLPLAGQAVTARWEAELDRWIYRAGVGLRVQWLGSRK